MKNLCENVVGLNKPPNIPIRVARGFINRLFKAKKFVEINHNTTTTTLYNNIDLFFFS